MNGHGRYFGWVLLAALALAPATRAAALIVVPMTSGNASAPTPDLVTPTNNPAWLNVGNHGVYVGDRWVLTAAHVPIDPTTLTTFPGVAGSPFALEPGSVIQLKNPSDMGLTQYTDLKMYRLTTAPDLPTLSIATASPAAGDDVIFVGDGVSITPTTAERHWNVTITQDEDDNDVWTWTTAGPDGQYHGYISDNQQKLWGTNIVEPDEPLEPDDIGDDPNNNLVVTDAFGDVISFYTDFDRPGAGASPSEAQATFEDSGSATFVKENGKWVLGGITFGVDQFPMQPSDIRSAVFGNLTFAADLSAYRDQIMAIMVPEVGSWLLVGAAAALAVGDRVRKHLRRKSVA